MSYLQYVKTIADQLQLSERSVTNTLELLSQGATVPFIARYRKEKIGNLGEVEVFKIEKELYRQKELSERKEFVLKIIDEQGKLTEDLRATITKINNLNELEDLYAPFKRKRKTKADVAKERGLEPLAKIIMSQQNQDIKHVARKFINKEVETIQEAISGAKEIIAEWVGENIELKSRLKARMLRYGILTSKVVEKKKEEANKYLDYFDFHEKVERAPSHRVLAMLRGREEGYLNLHIETERDRDIIDIQRSYVRGNTKEAEYIKEAIEDGYKRLMLPSITNLVFGEIKERADDEAISVFGLNIRQLLLAAPLGEKAILAIDPGYKTGCKVVCLSDQGEFLHNTTIFPFNSQAETQNANRIIQELLVKYKIMAIAIGNGTASRETKAFLDNMRLPTEINLFVVSESGASIYSASEVAREEFPDQDITVRGAISIGRRLLDPLAELVKLDPKVIGVGQYQHDVNQSKLKQNLDYVVTSCVNSIGINLNTASKHLLTYVAGLGPTLAQNIINYRKEIGQFVSIQQLKKVPRLGEKAFEQAAGFLRIKDGDNVLDNTGVHPESYSIVQKMAKDNKIGVSDLIIDKTLISKIELQKYVNESVGIETMTDIVKELLKPGHDPRGMASVFAFDEKIKNIDDVYEGLVVPGIVTNLTNFGAFVDIGVKQDGLLHISQITTRYIQSPSEVLRISQELSVKVIGVDKNRNRINLTLLF